MTIFGKIGKLKFKDGNITIKEVSSSKIVDLFKKKAILIPKLQRELEENKIENIRKETVKYFGNGNNYLVQHGYTLSLCQLENNFYVIDGQHRLIAIQRLNEEGYNFDILVRILRCENSKDIEIDFKLMNINSKIPIILTMFEDVYLKKTICEVANRFKTKYSPLFNRYKTTTKNTYRIHFNKFLELLEPSRVSLLYKKNNVEIEDSNFLFSKMETINEEIGEYLVGKKDYINRLDSSKMDKCGKFYLTLRNIKWTDYLFGNSLIVYEVLEKRKATIPKSLRKMVFDRDFGGEYRGNCYVCMKEIDRDEGQMGHIVPESKGGETIITNLRAICGCCNLSIGTQNMNFFKNKHFYECSV
jgi:hypothetical protein